MIDLFFRKFYTLWGSIMLVLPVSVCVAWFVITDGAESAEQARMMFMGSCRMFAYYDFTWFLCVFFSALISLHMRLWGNYVRNSKVKLVLNFPAW